MQQRPVPPRVSRSLAAVVVVAVAAVGLVLASNRAGSPAGDGPSAAAPLTGGIRLGSAYPVAPLGVKWDWATVQPSMPYLRSLPGGATFFEVVWCDVEPRPGQWDWSKPDGVARQTRALGFVLQIKIRTGACWVTRRGPQYTRPGGWKTESEMPSSLTSYAGFVRQVVQRYARYGVHEFAVENEASAPHMWGGSLPDLMSLTRVAAAAIRAADPAAQVVDWGLNSFAYGAAVAAHLLAAGHGQAALVAYNQYFAENHTSGGRAPVSSVADLRSRLGSGPDRNNLVFMAADAQLLSSHVFDIRQVHFYQSAQSIPALLAYLHAATPATTPIEAWEVGQFWPGVRSTAAASTLDMAKTVVLLLAGGVRQVIWLPLDGAADSQLFPLQTTAQRASPAGPAFHSLAVAVAGTTAHSVAAAGLAGGAFTRGGWTTVVLWATGAAGVRVPLSTAEQPASLAGAPIRPRPPALVVSSTPVLIRVHAGSASGVARALQGGSAAAG